LFEAALCSETGADLAYYDEGSVAGRLRPGLVRSGDIYSLESWQENSEGGQIRGSNPSAALQESLRDLAIRGQAAKISPAATTEYVATKDSEKLGRIQGRRPGTMLRDVTVAYLRGHGFPNGRT